MSRIGLQPITIPAGVEITIGDHALEAKGAKGILNVLIPSIVKPVIEEGVLRVERKKETRQAMAFHGLIRSLIANAITGVSEGFVKQLEVQGVGYRAAVKGSLLVLTVGYSHDVEYPAPEGITFSVKGSIISVSGIDKQQVGEVTAQIRRVRPPDSYKGKGIRYVGEVVRLKAGKAAKTA